MEREFLEGLGLEPQTVEAVLQEHEKTLQAHQTQVQHMVLTHAVESAVQKAGGRNLKAVAALLDMEAIGSGEDVAAAAEEAVCALKKEHGYLFRSPVPPYAHYTGSQAAPAKPTTLAGALREHMRRK